MKIKQIKLTPENFTLESIGGVPIKKAKKSKTIYLRSTERLRLLLGICETTGLSSKDENVIDKIVDLQKVQNLFKDIDVPEISRRLRDSGIVTYSWNNDRSRNISITKKGFKSLQQMIERKGVILKK